MKLTHFDPGTPAQPTAWGQMSWLASKDCGNATGLTLGRVTIKAGQQNPRHCHPTCEEVLHLLSGRLIHTLANERIAMEAGDTIVIPAGVYHNAINVGSQSAEMVVAFSSAVRDFKLEEPGHADP